jgi:hypothetical protein
MVPHDAVRAPRGRSEALYFQSAAGEPRLSSEAADAALSPPAPEAG